MIAPLRQRHGSSPPDLGPARRRAAGRWDLLAVLGGVALVLASASEGRRLLTGGTDIFLGFPPLLASWTPHLGPGTAPAVVTAVAVVLWGTRAAERLSWRPLLLVCWAAATTWTTSLALVDGWARGIAGRLATDQEYLYDLPSAPSISGMLGEFTARMPTDQAVHWTTHVGGHPPGALLVFLVLDRIGLAGGGGAGLFCIVVGSSAVAAVALTLRALGAEATARQVLPFAVLFPGAIWVGVSADGMFAGVLAWAAALLAVGATRRGTRAQLAALGGGLLFGCTLYLSYGLVLGVCVALAVIGAVAIGTIGTATGDPGVGETPPLRMRPVVAAGVGAGVVVVAFTASGFWWPTGFDLVRMLYAASIARSRPYEYFWWGNLAALLFVLGPAVLVGLRRVVHHPRTLPVPALLLTAAGVVAILAADLSGLSKGEVERIWLPFAIWVVIATALVPPSQRRGWLAVQAALALLTNHLLLTVW